jgi:uncharacterized protein YcbK (DUF882 family)
MARRPPTDRDIDLRRIRREQAKTPRARLRIVITSDPTRPIRTLTLPASLPRTALILGTLLAVGTVILVCGSWRLNDARYALERRLRSMLQAADSMALAAPGPELAGVWGTGQGGAARGTLRPPSGEVASFVLQSVNTGEEMEIRFNRATGEMEPDAYRRFRHMMRCLHTTAEAPIDPRLIELLYRIASRTGGRIQLVSGFRAPMYSRAKLSYHTRGMAADIRIPGLTTLMARDLAESLGVPGLGYYPVSGFIHVDVRDNRTRWIDYGQDRADADGAEHDPAHSDAVEPAEEAEDGAPGQSLQP